MRELYMRNGEGFVLICSITDQRSFDELDTLRRGIVNNQDVRSCSNKSLTLKDPNKVCIVVAGNKCDLEERRKVDKEAATAAAAEWGHPYIECSAKDGINVNEIFESLVQQKWALTGGAPPALRRKACSLF